MLTNLKSSMEVMGDRPVVDLWGVGTKTARKLEELGLSTVRRLAAADVDVMRRRFGPTMGPWYILLGRGVGSTELSADPHEARSRSHQTTFPVDLVERAGIERELIALAEHVTADVVAEGRWVNRVAITVRHRSFFTQTRITKLAEPTRDARVVADAAVGLLERFDLNRPVRLLGVRAELTTDRKLDKK